MKSNIFKDFFSPSEEVSLSEIFKDIQSEKYISEISSIRYAVQSGKEELSQSLKKTLPAFTPSGTFTERRAIKNLKQHSGVIHLDIDDVSHSEIEELKKKIDGCSFTFASFISPRGSGIKVFVKAEVNSETHGEVWKKLDDLYSEIIGFRTDNKCKDVSRLCFFSYDPDMYINEESEVFKWSTVENQKPITMDENKLEACQEFTEKKETYVKGNRHNFILLFACNANRFGIDKEEALDFCLTNYDLGKEEVKATFKSVYKNNANEFAKFANIATPVKAESEKQSKAEEDMKKMENVMKSTPTIPKSVYETLPSLLKESCEVFDDAREKDVFLTSAISILSGCLPNVTGLYFSSTVYTHLFSFILAPPASGKGSLNYAKMLANEIHKQLLEESRAKQADYKVELREYKKRHQGKGKGADAEEQEPVEPPFKVLFIPANTSNSKVYEHLEKNGGKGIICETEADTLGEVFKNDWGSYTDLLRKAFHHERMSISRKTDNLYNEIENPRLSVVLTGTPNQILNIIRSAEDGLFSRFQFYTFSADPVWKSPAPQPGKPDLSKYFSEKSLEVCEMHQMLENSPTIVSLTENQWSRFNNYFNTILHEVNELVSSEATSVVKRLGLILFRMCLILTALRKYENAEATHEMTCEDTDFDTALAITKILLEHSIILYTNLPGGINEFKIEKTPKKKKFLESLPQEFKRKEAIEIGGKMKIPVRTIDHLLGKVWLDTHVEKVDTGVYRKL